MTHPEVPLGLSISGYIALQIGAQGVERGVRAHPQLAPLRGKKPERRQGLTLLWLWCRLGITPRTHASLSIS